MFSLKGFFFLFIEKLKISGLFHTITCFCVYIILNPVYTLKGEKNYENKKRANLGKIRIH